MKLTSFRSPQSRGLHFLKSCKYVLPLSAYKLKHHKIAVDVFIQLKIIMYYITLQISTALSPTFSKNVYLVSANYWRRYAKYFIYVNRLFA